MFYLIVFYLIVCTNYCFSIFNAKKELLEEFFAQYYSIIKSEIANGKKGKKRVLTKNKENLYSCPSTMGLVKAIS